MNVTFRHRLFQLAVAALLVMTIAALLSAKSVGAIASNPKMLISADNTFYMYVKGGEKLSVAFNKSPEIEPGGQPRHDIAVSIDGPGLATEICTIPKDVAIGKGCEFKDVVAPQTGVYRVVFKLPDAAEPYKEVSPTVKWGGNLFSWSIAVRDGATEKQGRVWSELYAVRQSAPESFLTDLTYYYVSENGYVYRAGYKGYNGQISTFSADAVGIRKGSECVSAYKSIEVNNTEYSPSFGACGGSYKLFFEQPAGDLPLKAVKSDGKASEWILPTVASANISGLQFISDKTGDAQSGKIRFKLENFVGQYTVDIDTSGDGGFSSKEDVKIKRTMKKMTSDVQEVVFSGVDAKGQVVPSSQPIRIRINVEKVAEIHLVNADVEGRTGGLELVRLSGENAPASRMCWNDTDVSTLANISLQTKDLDGRACPDSTTSKLHGWPYATGSWGDNRYIDDWAYASASIEGVPMITYPEENDDVTGVASDKTMRQSVIVVGAVLLLFVVVFIMIVIVRHRRHARMLQKAAEQYQPLNVPGQNDPRPPFGN